MKYLNVAGYVAIPLAFVVHYLIGTGASWEPGVTFLLAALGVIPLAHLMGRATEQLSVKTGPTWGGLLNATFGNAAELIIAIIAMSKGLNDIVKASLTGSILGNLLLVGGAAMVAGGARREKQTFNRSAAENNAGLLVLAVAGMLFPAIFHFTGERVHDSLLGTHDYAVSAGTSTVLLVVYALGLYFTLKTHAHIYSRTPHAATNDDAEAEADNHGSWSVKKSVLMLLLASAGIGIIAELLVGSAEAMAHMFGWNAIFVGVILLAIIGNAAEHSTALLLAMKDDMDTAMTICYQSSLQIALFATPFLVLLSWAMTAGHVGHSTHLDMVFSPMEVAAVILAVAVVVVLGLNGETNWFEGVMLLALYMILAIAFFFLPQGALHETATTVPTRQ